MAINPDDMKLTRAKWGIDPAWRWVAPTGKVFYFQQLTPYGDRRWFWFSKSNNGGDGAFNTLKELKAHVARFFGDDD
jgi:hypothetical protein